MVDPDAVKVWMNGFKAGDETLMRALSLAWYKYVRGSEEERVNDD